MQLVQWISLKFSRSFVSFFALRMHKLHLCIQLIRAADHVIINIAWSLAWSIRNDDSLFAFSHAGLVEGFSCLLCWFWHLNFSFRLVFFPFSCYGRGNSAMPWWNSNIVWVSENLKRNMKRFQEDSSGRKVFSADPVTCMMGIYDKMITGTAAAEIPLKPRIWDLFKSPRRSYTNSDPHLLSLTRNVFIIVVKVQKFLFPTRLRRTKQDSLNWKGFFCRSPWPSEHLKFVNLQRDLESITSLSHIDSLAQALRRDTECREKFDPVHDMVQWPVNSASNAKVCSPNGVLSGQLDDEKKNDEGSLIHSRAPDAHRELNNSPLGSAFSTM